MVFGIVVGIIAAIAVVSMVITYVILRPLAILSQHAEALSEMDVEKMQKPLDSSRISEVNGLVKAFNFLIAMRAYMPESMFVKTADGDLEEEPSPLHKDKAEQSDVDTLSVGSESCTTSPNITPKGKNSNSLYKA